MEEVFLKWKDELLDLGKGNPLINFKNPKAKSLKIIYPSCDEIFTAIYSGGKRDFCGAETFFADTEEFNAISESDVTNICIPKLKKNEILAYNKYNKTNSVIKNLKKTASETLTERGLNILYIALGFLKWENNGDKLFSPLV